VAATLRAAAPMQKHRRGVFVMTFMLSMNQIKRNHLESYEP
jgi:hypothetical protein